MCGISQLSLRTVEDLKKTIRDCCNDFKMSTWKKTSRGTWGKIKVSAENG
jgi:hypothetical protein